MEKRYIWKECHITSGLYLNRLQACWDSSRKAFGRREYTFYVGKGMGVVETDLPWSGLRDLFRFADVPFPSLTNRWLTSTEPSWFTVREE